MHRSKDYDSIVSKKLQKPSYARAFIGELLSSDEEELSVEDVLRLIARIMGTTEFASFVGEKISTVDKFIKGHRNPKVDTLNKYLKPFGMETVLTIRVIKRKKAA